MGFVNEFIDFIRLLLRQRSLIFSMARREVMSKYIGSFLGFVWTFIQPMVMIFVFWFVFSVGFKTQPLNGVPFAAWMATAMAVWTAFADIIGGSSGVVIEHANLIKKTTFQAHILPIIKIASCLITHMIFIAVLFALFAFQKMPFSFYYLQSLYYLTCMVILALGLSWGISAINVFIRDVGPLVTVLLNVGLWATPIFWDLSIMPPGVQTVLKLNPMYYVVQGYRESFIYFVPFWKHPALTVYFWALTSVIFIMGALIFKKLKPQFADTL